MSVEYMRGSLLSLPQSWKPDAQEGKVQGDYNEKKTRSILLIRCPTSGCAVYMGIQHFFKDPEMCNRPTNNVSTFDFTVKKNVTALT